MDPGIWMDLVSIRLPIIKLLTWLITLLDKNQLEDQNVVLGWISTFHHSFTFWVCGVSLGQRPEYRSAVRGEEQ